MRCCRGVWEKITLLHIAWGFLFSCMTSPFYYLLIAVEERNKTTYCFLQTSAGDNEKETVRRKDEVL